MNQAINGFEQDDVVSFGREWLVVRGSVTLPLDGRRGTKCVRITQNSPVSRIARSFPAHASYVFGMALEWESFGPTMGATLFCAIYDDAGNAAFRLGLNTATGKLYCLNPSNVQIWTSTRSFLPNVPYYLEVECKLDNSAGTFGVYVNGSAAPDATLFSGDTILVSGTGTDKIATFALGEIAGGNQILLFGDFYANDGSGSAPDNGRWGDTKVTALRPNATGFANTLNSKVAGGGAPSANNYQDVDDDGASDDDVSYVYGTGGYDLYNFPALGYTASVIRAVCGRFTTRKLDATPRQLKLRTRSGGAEASSAGKDMSTVYTVETFLLPVNPVSGSAWDQTTLEAAEFGPEIV